MDLIKLNNLGLAKETKKISDLEVNKPYRIYDSKAINTKYGRRVIVCLEDVDVFLPARYQELDDEEVENLKQFCLINKQKESDTYAKIEFIR